LRITEKVTSLICMGVLTGACGSAWISTLPINKGIGNERGFLRRAEGAKSPTGKEKLLHWP